MVEEPLSGIQEIDLLVAIAAGPSHQGEEAGVQGGGIAHLDVDLAHPLEKNETGTVIRIEAEIVIETGITMTETETGTETEIRTGRGIKTGIGIGTGTGREDEEETER